MTYVYRVCIAFREVVALQSTNPKPSKSHTRTVLRVYWVYLNPLRRIWPGSRQGMVFEPILCTSAFLFFKVGAFRVRVQGLGKV